MMHHIYLDFSLTMTHSSKQLDDKGEKTLVSAALWEKGGKTSTHSRQKLRRKKT